MTLLEQLEHELERVRKQLHRLRREHAVLTEQMARLQMGTPPEVVCAALHVAFGIRLDLHQAEAQELPPPIGPDLGERKAPSAKGDGEGRPRSFRRLPGIVEDHPEAIALT